MADLTLNTPAISNGKREVGQGEDRTEMRWMPGHHMRYGLEYGLVRLQACKYRMCADFWH